MSEFSFDQYLPREEEPVAYCANCAGPIYHGEPVTWGLDGPMHRFISTCNFHGWVAQEWERELAPTLNESSESYEASKKLYEERMKDANRL